MQLVLGLTSGMQLHQIHDLANVAEKINIRKVWVGDDILGAHDVFTVASSLLLKHGAISVGIGVTSPLIRNITTIARASVALAQIGGDDRFSLGLGVGGLQDLRKLGIAVRNPTSVLRSASTILREIWKGKKVTFETGDFKLNHYRSSVIVEHPIPIFLGVRGPRLLNLAGETADGIVLSGPKTYLKEAIRLVKDSLEKNGRPIKDFTFAVWIPTMLVPQKSDLSPVKQTVAHVLSDTPKNVLEMAELDSARVARVREAVQRDGAASAAKLVNEVLLNETAVQGNARQICRTLKAFERIGVQEVVFGPPYGAKPVTALEEVADAWRGPT
jgi:5,10-methylenetetrahydromethanopterin reductase